LIQFIESEKLKGRNPSTKEMRNVILAKKNKFENVLKSTKSKETGKMCKFFIEELNYLYQKTLEYDLMEETIQSINKEKIPNLMI
ncbi:MAG TPA: hypothetical protein VIK84_02640, partial [Haloplasmataceae bacterium]